MTEALHCNWLKCRKPVGPEGRAVVTSCSHIFCVPCAEELFTAEKVCPACKAPCPRPDDVIATTLNPSADYKSTIMAGFSPTVAADVLSRSLFFWQYQQKQELAYQEMLLKSALDQVKDLEGRLSSIVSEANREIQLLQQREANLIQQIVPLQNENADLVRMNGDLRKKFRRSSCSKLSASTSDSRSSGSRGIDGDAVASHSRDHDQSTGTPILAPVGSTEAPSPFWQPPSRAFNPSNSLKTISEGHRSVSRPSSTSLLAKRPRSKLDDITEGSKLASATASASGGSLPFFAPADWANRTSGSHSRFNPATTALRASVSSPFAAMDLNKGGGHSPTAMPLGSWSKGSVNAPQRPPSSVTSAKSISRPAGAASADSAGREGIAKQAEAKDLR